MVYIYETFDSQHDAELYRDRYYRSYHPVGYGTHIAIHAPDKHRPRDPDKWVAIGSRGSGCD
jgi:hypothetical protein